MFFELLSTSVHYLKVMVQLSVLRNWNSKNDNLCEKVVCKNIYRQSFCFKDLWKIFVEQTIYIYYILRSLMF